MTEYTFTPMEAPNWESLAEFDEWTRVEGGGLSAPIYIRIVKTSDGKVAIDGLMIGGSWPRPEVTANSLREIRPREILNALFAEFDPFSPPDYEDWEESITWGLMNEVYMMRLPRSPIESAGVRGAATVDRLEEFSRRYTAEVATRPKGAMSATAKAMNISRATAHRWADQARAKGLLPPKIPRN